MRLAQAMVTGNEDSLGQVDVDGAAEVGVGGGVVDEYVKSAEALDGGGHTGLGLLRIAPIGGEHGRVTFDGGGRFLEGVDLAGRQHHRRAVLGVDPGDGRADALGSPRHQGDLPFQVQAFNCHPVPP